MRKSWWLLSCLMLSSLSCSKSSKDGGAGTAITAEQTLSKLIVIADQLEPEFNPFVNQYTLAGGETRKNKLSLNLAPVNPKLQIQVNGVKLRSDFTTDPMPLTAGSNAFAIDLVDEAGAVVNTYKLSVQRVQQLADEEMDDLATSDGRLVPEFSPAVLSYALTVGKDTSVLTVSPLAAYPDEANFVINGVEYTADLGGYDVNIIPGANTVTIEVKGKSGRSKIYTITVTRPSA